MNEEKLAVTFGALLHDVGKVVYRGWSGAGTHSKLGADFLKETIPDDVPFKREVVQQARYHHADEMSKAKLPNTLPTYITYFADNISAGMDRKNEGSEHDGARFDRALKLRRVFNVLNGHHDDNIVDNEDYNTIRDELRRELSAPNTWGAGRVGSLLNVLEAHCASVPSSTNTGELADISLFDHLKTTAGIAACMYDWLAERGVSDYAQALFNFEKSKPYYDVPMFLLWSCDLSGIQNFIYSISGSGALKQLRARSFYLELLLEHCMDELLERLELTRCNLLYAGGGHAYALLPNTQAARDALDAFAAELNGWLLEYFATDLYCACACVSCSANDLMNKAGSAEGAQRYRRLFQRVGKGLSEAKASRYTAVDIKKLNFADASVFDHSRECSECRRSAADLIEVEENRYVCPLCASLAEMSPDLVKKDADGKKYIFVVSDEGALELPFNAWLSLVPRKEYLDTTPEVRRIYTREWDAGLNLATHLWVGDYTAAQNGEGIAAYAHDGISLPPSTESLGEKAGIRRLGVLRADVDNLGAAFSHGFPDDKASISRTATLSRSLSYFFKHQLNEILEAGQYRSQIIYSGGDDIFLIGNWLDVVYAALDIKHALDDFTGNGSLTISAGIGMYDAHYPLARMASEVGELEDAAKAHPGKNALALWSAGNVFSWDEFEGDVLPKLHEVEQVFKDNDKGKAFIYKLVELLRNTAAGDVISVPRLAYLLARSFEGKGNAGKEAADQFYKWATNKYSKNDRLALTTALEIYVYSIRERG